MIHAYRILLSCAMVLGAFWGSGLAENNRVLIVHSSSSGFSWVQGINTAIKERFEGTGIDYHFFYMDTHQNSCISKKKQVCLRGRKLMERFKPRVVISVDDDAQEYFVKPYVANSTIQFVFCGVNAEPEKYGYPAPNVTGILERTYPEQALRLLKFIVPEMATTIGISDDSFTSSLVMQRLKSNAVSGISPVRIVDFLQPATFAQWVSTVDTYERAAEIGSFLIPFTETVKQDWDHENMSPAEIMMWTTDNVSKPIVGLWQSAADQGALCAVVVDPKEHGTVAALMAKKILAGKHASQIPIVINQDGYVIINLRTAERLNIDVPFSVLQSADKIIE